MPEAEDVKKHLYQGLIPAVPVPFTKEGRIDEKSQEQYVRWMNDQPVPAVSIWAHTGRGLFLSQGQREYIFKAWRKGLDRSKLIICGVGAANSDGIDEQTYIKEALTMGREAKALKADAILTYAPTYYRGLANQDEKVIKYHEKLAELDLPMILFFLYEEAGGITYSKEVLKELFRLTNVVGIKMATLDSVMTYQDVSNLILSEAPGVSLITGEDRMFGYTISRGAVGALVGLGAVYTSLQHQMMQSFYQKDFAKFIDLTLKVDRLAECTFIQPMEGYIERLLYILAKRGIIDQEGACDPYGPGITEAEKKHINKIMEEFAENRWG